MSAIKANVERLQIPPHSIDSEQSVLGALLMENAGWDDVGDLLSGSDFYRHDHRMIWETIERLAHKGEPFDAIIVHEALDGDDIPLSYLGQLASEVPSAANVVSYAKMVREYSQRRAMIQVAERMKGWAYEPAGLPMEQILDHSERMVLNVAHAGLQAPVPSMKEALVDVVDRIDTLFQQDSSITGVGTGLADLDELLSGLQPADLIVFGGRPSMGKTSLAMNIVEHAAVRDKVPAHVFSLEMSRTQLITRMLASLGRIDMHKLLTGKLGDEHWPRLTSAVGFLADAPIYVDDTAALTTAELRSRARRIRREHNTGLIVIDYLQLMSGTGENRNLEISGISRELKALAKELNVPVVAISQLNRGVEQRQEKRPTLADLRDSGSIEQDADVVLFVYRDEVYNKDSRDKDTAELIVAKHRNGKIGEVRLTWVGEFTRFENKDYRYG